MPDEDLEHIRAIKRRAQARLLCIPGVNAVGLGAKHVAGRHTGELAIMVFVEKKRPAAELAPHELIPPEFEGIKTDIFEEGRPQLHLDDASRRPLTGGVKLGIGGTLSSGGTLGFIARTNEAIPRIVGVTNHHVVGMPVKSRSTTLRATVSQVFGGARKASLRISGPNAPRDLVLVQFYDTNDLFERSTPLRAIYYETTATDTSVTIAAALVPRINALAAELSASIVPLSDTIDLVPNTPTSDVVISAATYGAHLAREETDLARTINGNEITLLGKTADLHGVHVTWNTDGSRPTQGVFVRVKKNTELAQVASDIAKAVNSRNLQGILATPIGQKITIAGAHQVDCEIASDIRVGQPTDCFCSACSSCCGNRIGMVLDARIDIDAALIELDPGLDYRPMIRDIGGITGTRTYTALEVKDNPPHVFKRGYVSGKTSGTIVAVEITDFGGFSPDQGAANPSEFFYRLYDNGIRIKGDAGQAILSLPGDSGSGIVNDANQLVGLWSGGKTVGLGTPIELITKAFNLTAESTTAALKDNPPLSTVPRRVGDAQIAEAPMPIFVERLREMENGIVATDEGRELTAIGRRHAEEIVHLVNNNRRVGTVWRRNGGAELLSQLIATLQENSPPQLPQEVAGRPIAETLRAMQSILLRYGSEKLARDLREFGPRIIELTKFDYPTLLGALGATRPA